MTTDIRGKKSIPMLPDGGTIQDTDYIPISRNGASLKATIPLSAYQQIAIAANATANQVLAQLDRKINADVNGFVPIDALPLATENDLGVLQCATPAMLNNGLSRSLAITPYALANSALSLSVQDMKRVLVEVQYALAMKAELQDGVLNRAEMPLATDALIGAVKPDNITTTVDVDGTIHANVNISYASTAEVNGGTISTKAVTPQSLAQSSYVYALRQLQNTVTLQAQQIADLQARVRALENR